jgi:ankyrin repeat protein
MTTSDPSLRRIALSALLLIAIAGCDQAADQSTKAPTTPAETTATAAPADTTTDKSVQAQPSSSIQTVQSTADAATSLTKTARTGKGKENGKEAVTNLGTPDSGSAKGLAERIDSTPLDLTFDPPKLDLGVMQPGVPKTGTVKITNNGVEPIQIKKAVASCGCTTPTWPKDPIGPGETAELEITLKPALKQGQRLSKRVTLQMVSGAPQVITVEGEVGLFVKVEPDFLDASKKDIEGQGAVVLESADETPFMIISADPPVVTGLGDEKALKHELAMDWDAWEAAGRRPAIKFTTDHPNAPELSVTVRRAISRDKPLPPSSVVDRPVASKLVASAQGNDVEGVKRALEAGDALDASALGGMTALHWAAKNGNAEIVGLLLEAGADVNAGNKVGKTAVALAAENGQIDVLRALVDKGGAVDSTDEIGGTPLLWAAALSKNAETVAFLIEKGANVNVIDSNGMTPLIWAAGIGRPEAVGLLIDKGADLEVVEMHQKETALMRAARIGSVESLNRILAAKPDLAKANMLGQTAMIIAAASAPVDKLQALVDAGADLGARDTRGWSVLDHARARTDANRTAVIEFLTAAVPAEVRDADPIVGG